MNVKHLRVLAIENPSITAGYYHLSFELEIVMFALPASQSCYRSQLMEKAMNIIIIRKLISCFYYL